MPTINKLPLLGTPSGADQIPVYAPNSGDARRLSINGLVDYFQDTLVFPDPENASYIDYDPAGAGAVQRTVQSKLRDVVSVKDFGAVGDGVTDDTAAIQAAINFGAGRCNVVFPDGDYLVSSSIVLPSASYIFGGTGMSVVAGAASFSVFKTVGFTSSLTIESIVVKGNGYANVTAFEISNTQFHSQINNVDVFMCENGIILDSVCIGISIANPTMFRVENAIQIKGNSNANAVFCPVLDNAVVTAGGTGTGTGVYIVGGTNQIYGGFVQGFEYGVYDAGQYTGIDGVYFETCTNAAVYSDGAIGCLYKNVFHFGYNDVPSPSYAFVGVNSSGVTVLYPNMVQGNSTGGLYYYVNGNTNCTESHITNNGTSNTVVGSPNQISPIGTATSQFKPSKIKNGTAATGVTVTPFSFVVSSPNSVSLCEVTLLAQEQTGFVATSTRKFLFALTNTSGTLSASAITTDSTCTNNTSSGNYSITVNAPSVSVVNATTANFSFSLTTGGAIGWVDCKYTVSAQILGSSTCYVS